MTSSLNQTFHDKIHFRHSALRYCTESCSAGTNVPMDRHGGHQRPLRNAQGDNPSVFSRSIRIDINKGITIRLIHAKEPGRPFQKDFDSYPLLAQRLERALCPRVHFKIIIIDSTLCYLGSANLTGAGMGIKSSLRRNFEAGILTDETAILNPAIEEFDKVWRGTECLKCQRKQYCPAPII